MRSKKSVFSTLFIISVIILILLPFLTTFQDVLTHIIMRFDIYKSFQNLIVPYEMRVITGILDFIGLNIRASASYIQFERNGNQEAIYLIWNCIGWQSFVLLFISLITGLSHNHTFVSKGEAFLIGILGTYLVNIFRLVSVIVVYYFTGRGIGVVFHDYFSNILTIVWLFFFWWLSYKFVLEEKTKTSQS